MQKTRIYERILLDIILGELPPMHMLDERALARQYAAGVAGVRDALGRLALEGLVMRRPRVGTAVSPLDIREIEHAYDVRRLLEGRAASLAARAAKAADIAVIVQAFDGAESAVAACELRVLLGMDRAFHAAVARATYNPTLARFVMHLQNLASRFWIWEMEKQSAEDQLQDVYRHRALAAAIASHDPLAAEAAAVELVGAPPSAYR
ncbi:GntR family transcriptional regulator [Phenylobacterium sp.]|uniref:GntR family transcriptional regulator n=1 Tax=Phenylobacterium sp. TaxID=1871053 RepID=UPI003BAAB9B3